MLDKSLLTGLLESNDVLGATRYLQRSQKGLGHSDFLYLRSVYEKELQQTAINPLRVAILRSYTIETMTPYFEVLCKIAGFQPLVYLAGYGQVFQEVLNGQSALYDTKPEIIFLFMRLEDIRPEIVQVFLDLSQEQLREMLVNIEEDVEKLISNIRKHTQASIVVSNFIVPSYPTLGIYDATSRQSQTHVVERLNMSIAEILAGHSNCYLMDLDQVASRLGKIQFFDPRMYYVSKAPYSRDGFLEMAREILKFVKVIKGQGKKCIVLDCDNTLWGGIVGEDGIDGIELGSEYPGICFREFQQQLLSISRKGFVLAINSKNNESDVMEVLNTHPHQVLKEENFACLKVNWGNKVDNMHAIAAELNLGVDSFVYLDDDPAECKLIEDNLPEVLTIQVPKEPIALVSLLNEIDELEILSLTAEDRTRPKLYRKEAKRKQLKASVTSLEDFYASLGMEMEVFHNQSGQIPRLAEMTQRTNQFNLTTHRYSESEIRRFIESNEYELYAFALRDIFGDSGVVGEAIFKKMDSSVYEIDTLLLSCRVIGRTAEDSFVNYCLKKLREKGVKKVIGQYTPTKKNAVVQGFYDKMGFSIATQADSGEKVYELDLDNAVIHDSKWIKVKG